MLRADPMAPAAAPVPAPATAPDPAISFDPLLGATADDGWFPSPAHILRRAAILEMFAQFPPGRLVEMGCGAGRLLVDWHRLGHSGKAVEPDAAARQMASAMARRFSTGFTVNESADAEQFDYLVSTEVLEHLDDPEAVLRDWLRSLKPGGIALITVPAFRRYWGASDEWAGHVQRFEPEEFCQLLNNAGLQIIRSQLFGFPIGNWLRVLGNVTSAWRMRNRASDLDRQSATFASGRDRTVERRIAPLMRSAPMRTLLRLAIATQSRFNRGHGLIVVARKA